jgi:site-specific DNA recombinase
LRVSAADLEATVLRALRQKFGSLGQNGLTPADLVEETVARIALQPKHIVITLKNSDENNSESIDVPWSARNTRELAQIDEAGAGQRTLDKRLVLALVRAHAWLKLLSNGTYDSIETLARGVHLHPKHIRKAVRLAFLSAAITKSILCGNQSAALTLSDLDEIIALSWKEQQR